MFLEHMFFFCLCKKQGLPFGLKYGQFQVMFSESVPAGKATASEFEGENTQGRKVSKVIKTMVVQGERMEKQIGDPSLSADLPSAKEDFEKVYS